MTKPHEPPEEIVAAMTRQWRESSALGPEVLERLAEINRIYLQFLILESRRRAPKPGAAPAGSAPPGRPPRIRRNPRLAKFTPEQLERLARCPFSLFTAAFHDGEFWERQAEIAGVRSGAPAAKARDGRPDAVAFADLALFYAWHLVHSNPVAARVVLGMAEGTLAAFKRLSLRRIQQLSSENADLVTSRWPASSPFWRGLLSIARRGIEDRMTDLRLLGLHLIASKLSQRHTVQ